ncbi:MAG: restriction endonuclease [Gammaproteobacteria bacterium]|nr:restriction endonuclease [Gammaproteobacteria bacterium]
MIPSKKIYSTNESTYDQRTVRMRIEALFLDNLGLVVTRDQIRAAVQDPKTGKDFENWHQRLSELRTDYGYTILSWRDWDDLAPQEYVMPTEKRREIASKRVYPTKDCWKNVIDRSGNACEWSEDGQRCNLGAEAIDPIGGGTVKLTPDHMTPHSVDPNSDPSNPEQWQALCGRHQVMKKNFWDTASGKVNLVAILQASSRAHKLEALEFLKKFFGKSD